MKIELEGDDRRHENPDPRTATGVWLIAHGKHGKRKTDRIGHGWYPKWWLLLYFSLKALFMAFWAAVGVWAAKRFLP